MGKVDRLSITINEEECLAGVESCKHNLYGRVIWPKCSPPLKVDALHDKLHIVWKDLKKCRVTFLGKGFYEFSFSSLDDIQRVCSFGLWS